MNNDSTSFWLSLKNDQTFEQNLDLHKSQENVSTWRISNETANGELFWNIFPQ